MPMATRVSSEALPRCGNITTLSNASSASDTLGSASKTSSAAPAMTPPASASASAASSTTSPRDELTR